MLAIGHLHLQELRSTLQVTTAMRRRKTTRAGMNGTEVKSPKSRSPHFHSWEAQHILNKQHEHCRARQQLQQTRCPERCVTANTLLTQDCSSHGFASGLSPHMRDGIYLNSRVHSRCAGHLDREGCSRRPGALQYSIAERFHSPESQLSE